MEWKKPVENKGKFLRGEERKESSGCTGLIHMKQAGKKKDPQLEATKLK